MGDSAGATLRARRTGGGAGPGGAGKSRELLRRVAARKLAAELAAKVHLFLLALAALYALLLLASRLGGLLPDWFDPLTVGVVPAGALVCAVVFHRRTDPDRPARLVDARMKTDDLFLTAQTLSAQGDPSSLPPSPPARRESGAPSSAVLPTTYAPLVVEAAEARAATIDPREVVPWRPWSKTGSAAAVLAALALAALVLEQRDPFGRDEARKREADRRKKLEASRKDTAIRAAILKKESKGPASRELERLQAELKKALKQMRPKERRANLARLQPVQGEMGRLWRQAAKRKLADALRRSPTAQRFGGMDGKKMSEWKRDLAAGKTGALGKEVRELKEIVRKMKEAAEGAEREKLRQEARSRLRRLAQFARDGANSEALSRAISQACEQLEMSGATGLSQKALDALGESLDLTEQEIAALSRSVRELQTLEDALATMQMAKALNELECLDGKACGGCQGLGDYAALYRQLLAQAGLGRGIGPGMGGPGTGRGGEAPEDDALETEYKSELSRSSMTAGKMLMQWKTRGLGKRGRAREDFLRSVKDVKQGYEEAILREQVPPGYREAIKKYFDSIERAVDAGSPGQPRGPEAGGAGE